MCVHTHVHTPKELDKSFWNLQYSFPMNKRRNVFAIVE